MSSRPITVPAYFSDAQRQATREAGSLAGLEVVRILNEPTAASLAYGYREPRGQTVLVYDLGGGTFDVSIVHVEGDVTEVLASHGNNRLGGDDFDALLVDRLAEEFLREHGLDLRKGEGSAHSRLWWAVEEAKKQLSAEPYAKIREEGIVSVNGKPLHLEREISREEYEELIRPLVESTLESVSRALEDAGKKPSEMDAILLVGGSTRTPFVSRVLEERTGLVPRQEVHPDLCVALGAGILASRLSGRDVERVLVDVSPYSFGPSFLGERGGYSYPHCYKAVIHRNTPLPLTRAESYYTSAPYQSTVDIRVYQGEDEDALKNVFVGNFTIEGLTETRELNEVLCRMSLDLDGILRVTAIEKRTGKSRQITIQNAMRPKSEEELALSRKRLEELFSAAKAGMELFDESETSWEGTEEEFESFDRADEAAPEVLDSGWGESVRESYRLVERSRSLFGKMHDEDKEEAIDL
ncbi:MAG: Hsp70 family protein, partial [Vicinamibacteria bacterium]